MKNQLSILLVLAVLFSACTLEGAIQEPTQDGNNDTEVPVKPNDNNSESDDNEDNGIIIGDDDSDNNEIIDTPTDGDNTSDTPGEGKEEGENEPLQSDSIRLIQKGERVYSFKENEFLIEYPQELEGELSVESTEDFVATVTDGAVVSIKPLHNGPITVKACVGNYYNTCVMEVYDKLIFNLICEFSHETGSNPRNKNEIYNVNFLIKNDNLPASEDKYGVSYEYREIMNSISTNKTSSGRIGINTPYHAGTLIRKGGSSSAILSTVAFESITISGIGDKYIEFTVQDGDAFQQFASDAKFDFMYE